MGPWVSISINFIIVVRWNSDLGSHRYQMWNKKNEHSNSLISG